MKLKCNVVETPGVWSWTCYCLFKIHSSNNNVMRALRALERFLYDMESAGILTLDRFKVGSDFDTED